MQVSEITVGFFIFRQHFRTLVFHTTTLLNSCTAETLPFSVEHNIFPTGPLGFDHSFSQPAIEEIDKLSQYNGLFVFRNSMTEIFELDLSNDSGNFTVSGNARLLVPRQNHACVVLDDAIYISGGTDFLPNYEVHKTVERFSPAFDVSVFMPDLTVPRSQHVMGTIDGRLTVTGGFSSYGGEQLVHSERFNVELDQWEVMSENRFENETARLAGVGNVPISYFPDCMN
jgi:hypothetical protein